MRGPEDHEGSATISDRTSSELRFDWGDRSFVYNRYGLDFAEDTDDDP